MSTTSETTTVLLKKRERTQNWIPEEKSALFSLIKHHVSAIENKKIDAAASAKKSVAWQKIYCAFRGQFSADRDITRIKEQWRRMKAQARMEMFSYAEKVRTLGPDVAAKSRPPNLSIEVWRLMESVRKNDSENTDRSDDSQDNENPLNRMAIQAILDKLTLPTETPEPEQEIKIEVNSDTEDESNHGELSRQVSEDYFLQQKRPRIKIQGEPVDLEHRITCPDSVSTSRVENAVEHNDTMNELEWNNGPATCDKDKLVQRATWIFKSTQREHEIKLRMLHIELERAELQKQAAVNELKTSELKKQLMLDQVNEYYRSNLDGFNYARFYQCIQVRMVGERGSGAGKGGGSGGAVRDAGGSFGKMEAAHEDQYFYNLVSIYFLLIVYHINDLICLHKSEMLFQQKEQLQKMRESLHDEISFHEEQIKRHQEAINRHKKRITDMDQKE
ncbi:ATIF2 inhibitor, partial [Acromyrmex heyeri]